MGKNRMSQWVFAAAVSVAGVCLAQAGFGVGQAVEVREGDTWSPARIVNKEGRRYQIQYEDSADQEWVTTDRLRGRSADATPPASAPPTPAARPAPAAPDAFSEPAGASPAEVSEALRWAAGQEIESKRGTAWHSGVVKQTDNGWVLVHYTKANYHEWVEPWRLREKGSSEDGIGTAPMHPSVSPAEPLPQTAPSGNASGVAWREPRVGERVEVPSWGKWTFGTVVAKENGKIRVRLEDRRDEGEWHEMRNARLPGQKLEARVGDRVQAWDGSWSMATVVAREADRVKVRKDGWDHEMFHKWVTLGELRPAPVNDVPPVSGNDASALRKVPGYREADSRSARELSLLVPQSPWQMTPDGGIPLAGELARAAVIKGAAGRTFPRIVAGSRDRHVALVQSRDGNAEQIGLDRLDLATGQTLGSWSLPMPQNMNLADVSPDGTRALFRRSAGDNSRIDVYSLQEAQPQRISFLLPYLSSEGGGREIDVAAFVGNDRVLTGGGKGDLYLWDLNTGKAIYHCRYGRNTPIALSASGKYLAFCTGTDVLILEAQTGDAVAELPRVLARASSMAFSPSGKQLVACDASTIWVVNLTDGSLYREFTIPGSQRNTTIASPADGYALINGSILVDLERRYPLWKYEVPGNGLTGVLPSGRFVFADGVEGASAGAGACNLINQTLPHPAALKATQALGEKELLLIKPGAKLTLRTDLSLAGAEAPRIVAGVKSQLQDAGIETAEGQPVQLVLSIELGKSETTTLSTHGGMGPFARSEKVTYTPKTSRMRIVYEGRTLWETSTTTGRPGFMMRVKEGQSFQEAVDEQGKPNTGIFTQTRVPTCLVKPRNPMYLGASELTNRGLHDKRVEPELPAAPVRDTPQPPATPIEDHHGPTVDTGAGRPGKMA